MGRWNESIAAGEKAVKTRNGGNAGDWFVLALAHAGKGEQHKAAAWFDKAVAWTKQRDPANRDFTRFWSEAAALLAKPGPPADAGSKP